MKLFALLLLSSPAWAALTTVSDTLHKADGSTCSGTINISWSTFYDPTNTLIYAGSIQTPVINGVFSVSLATGYVNASNPSGFGYYSVAYQVSPTGCVPSSASWNVYASSPALTLNQVQTFNAPITQTVIPLSWLTPAGAVYQWCIAWNGTVYAPAPCGASSNPATGTSLGTVQLPPNATGTILGTPASDTQAFLGTTPYMYGATGNGTTSDQAAMNAAIGGNAHRWDALHSAGEIPAR